ncbi:ABC transporter ATP-binding protein [uncultured Roseobacter sp.]|uniref:ABC transporter ATP-binding protein n=1 Tax=uncultured Roseobacter sp. TaxID=114847 RepID=UPI002617B3CD|nr:ABC transporter ATP-binding protein [uncultured Roseobacter sp.]
MSSDGIEDQKLQSFEEGYQAGWDDAVKAQADEKMKISAEFGQNLQDMSFTYQEALSKLTLSIEPVMAQIVDKLLPALARQALGAHVIEQLCEMLKDCAGQPIEIVVAPASVETIKELGEKSLTDTFEVVEEASLGAGQAFVRVGATERSIDLDSVISGVSDALSAFFHETGQEMNNG